MSAAFLTELLEVDAFRCEIGLWLPSFFSQLGDSSEDRKSYEFAQSLLQSLEAKARLEAVKADCIQPFQSITSEPLTVPTKLVGRRSPDDPGAYIEARCLFAACQLYTTLTFIYVLCDGAFDWASLCGCLVCAHCRSPLTVDGIGFTHCKWWFQHCPPRDTPSAVTGRLAWNAGGKSYIHCYELSLMRHSRTIVLVKPLTALELAALERKLEAPAAHTLLATEQSREVAALVEMNKEIRRLADTIKRLNADLKGLNAVSAALEREVSSLQASSLS